MNDLDFDVQVVLSQLTQGDQTATQLAEATELTPARVRSALLFCLGANTVIMVGRHYRRVAL